MPGRSPGSFGGSAVSDLNPPEGVIKGLRLSWTNVTTISIAAGKCASDDAPIAKKIRSTGAIAVAITASGANGLDTGSEATSTWYSVWICSGSSGVAGLLSTSAASPTMPSGYAYKRRIGWIYNHSDDDIQKFHQFGKSNDRTVYHDETASDYALVLNSATQHNSVGVYTNVSCATAVAPTAHLMIMRFIAQAGGTGSCEWLSQDVDHLVWTRTRQDRSEYFIGDMPCETNRGIKWRTSSGSVQGQAIVLGWRETL